jgi:hypothetical protein
MGMGLKFIYSTTCSMTLMPFELGNPVQAITARRSVADMTMHWTLHDSRSVKFPKPRHVLLPLPVNDSTKAKLFHNGRPCIRH